MRWFRSCSSPPLDSDLTFAEQTSWLIPLYGFTGMVLALPWAAGWFRRDAHRPAAYLNILLTLLAFVHGSLVLQDVMALGPATLHYPWLSVADLQLDISFSLSLTNVAALELITGLSLVSQIYSLGYMDKEALARFFALLGRGRRSAWCSATPCSRAISCWRCSPCPPTCWWASGTHSPW